MFNISFCCCRHNVLTSLFSWLKGVPPGINPSSHQQKKVCGGLRLANGVAWGFHVGRWLLAQSCWLWLSSPEEEVWCPDHVGRPCSAMATLEEPAWDQRAWLVFTRWAWRAAFYKQVESARGWHERGIAYWWKHCGVAGLDYYSEPASAATPTCSTLGVSGRSRDLPWHVYPSRGGRTNNFPSIYPHPGGCKEEGAKKEEAGWWQCPDGVAAMLLCGKARPLVAWCHIWVFFTPGGEKSLDTLLDGLLTCRGWQFLSAYQYDWNAWIGAGTYWKMSLNINVFALPQLWRQLHYCLSLRASMYLAIMEVWHFLHAAEEVVRAGVFHSILHQVVKAWARFTCFTFHWLVSSGGFFCFLFGCCFGWVCCFHLVDQSLRSSYLPMTSLAQFRDCHSCYDERSIDQKKAFDEPRNLGFFWLPAARCPGRFALQSATTTWKALFHVREKQQKHSCLHCIGSWL